MSDSSSRGKKQRKKKTLSRSALARRAGERCSLAQFAGVVIEGEKKRNGEVRKKEDG